VPGNTAEALGNMADEIENIAEDVGNMADDVDNMADDVSNMAQDAGNIGEDVGNMAEDVGNMPEDVSSSESLTGIPMTSLAASTTECRLSDYAAFARGCTMRAGRANVYQVTERHNQRPSRKASSGDKLPKRVRWLGQLRAEGAADGHILRQGVVEGAHRPAPMTSQAERHCGAPRARPWRKSPSWSSER